MHKLSTESITLHRKISKALSSVYTCKHGNRRITDWSCPRCTKQVADLFNESSLQTVVLGRYIRDVLRCGERNPPFTRLSSACISSVIDCRVVQFERYLSDLSKKLHPSSLMYWKKFGSAQPDLSAVSSDAAAKKKSLFMFPGRQQVRNPIDFDGVDKQDCTKVYFKGKTTVPTFLTVQCCCDHPKLLGFVLIRECESIFAALSSILTHFPIPPEGYGMITLATGLIRLS